MADIAERTAPTAEHSVSWKRLVLFDGVCVFCDSAVRWLIARDPAQRFHFAALQSEAAAALRLRHPELPSTLETMAYVDAGEGPERLYLHSEAVFRVLADLGPPWGRLAVLRYLPRGLTDLGYRLFARWRYRVFGRLESCAVPTPAVRDRFLD